MTPGEFFLLLKTLKLLSKYSVHKSIENKGHQNEELCSKLHQPNRPGPGGPM